MLIIFLIFLHFFIFSFFFSNSHFFTFSSFHAHRHERKRSVPDWIIVVVVEWFVILKEYFLLERLTLANFSLIFVSKMCVFASRPMENVTFLKNDVFPTFVVDFLRPQQRHTPTHTNTNTTTPTPTHTPTQRQTQQHTQQQQPQSNLGVCFLHCSSFSFVFLHFSIFFIFLIVLFFFFFCFFFHVFFVFPSFNYSISYFEHFSRIFSFSFSVLGCSKKMIFCLQLLHDFSNHFLKKNQLFEPSRESECVTSFEASFPFFSFFLCFFCF